MLTFFPFISTIHGCSSIRHGVARRAGSFSRLPSLDISPQFPVTLPPSHPRTNPTPSNRRIKQKQSKANRQTHQHSIKYFIFWLHRISGSAPFAGSSFSFGSGWPTMYWMISMSPARGCISVPSAGKGKRCWATSKRVTPRDQTSEVMV